MSVDREPKITQETVKTLQRFIRPHARNAEDIDDIVQEVLVKVVKSGSQVSPAAFLGWLRTVSHSTTIDYYRKHSERKSSADPEEIAAESYEERTNELSKCVRPLLKKLSSDDQAILSSVELDGQAQVEVADALGLSYSTVKSRVQRARQRLKDEILQCCKVELDRRNAPVNVSGKKSDCC